MAVPAFCVVGLVLLVGVTVGLLAVSTGVGVIVGIVGALLAVPLVMALVAQLDLLRVKARCGFTPAEAEEFARLLPQVGAEARASGLSRGDMKHAAKQASAQVVLDRRAERRATP